MAMIKKAIVLGWLGRDVEELEIYDDIVRRFKDASDERLRDLVVAAEKLRTDTVSE